MRRKYHIWRATLDILLENFRGYVILLNADGFFFWRVFKELCLCQQTCNRGSNKNQDTPGYSENNSWHHFGYLMNNTKIWNQAAATVICFYPKYKIVISNTFTNRNLGTLRVGIYKMKHWHQHIFVISQLYVPKTKIINCS